MIHHGRDFTLWLKGYLSRRSHTAFAKALLEDEFEQGMLAELLVEVYEAAQRDRITTLKGWTVEVHDLDGTPLVVIPWEIYESNQLPCSSMVSAAMEQIPMRHRGVLRPVVRDEKPEQGGRRLLWTWEPVTDAVQPSRQTP